LQASLLALRNNAYNLNHNLCTSIAKFRGLTHWYTKFRFKSSLRKPLTHGVLRVNDIRVVSPLPDGLKPSGAPPPPGGVFFKDSPNPRFRHEKKWSSRNRLCLRHLRNFSEGARLGLHASFNFWKPFFQKWCTVVTLFFAILRITVLLSCVCWKWNDDLFFKSNGLRTFKDFALCKTMIQICWMHYMFMRSMIMVFQL